MLISMTASASNRICRRRSNKLSSSKELTLSAAHASCHKVANCRKSTMLTEGPMSKYSDFTHIHGYQVATACSRPIVPEADVSRHE